MRRRLGAIAGAVVLMITMSAAAAAAREDQTNLGQCVAEAKHALQGMGIKLKVGHFDDIELGTNGSDDFFPLPPGDTLFCGFAGLMDHVVQLEAGDVFVGGAGTDVVGSGWLKGVFIGGEGEDHSLDVQPNAIFLGGPGDDTVCAMEGGLFDGGPGHDVVNCRYVSGYCVNVEEPKGCPAP